MGENKIKSKTKINNWELCSRVFKIIEIFAIIGGIIFAVIQIRDVRNMQSAQLMLDFNNELSSDINSEIVTVIEESQPIFIKNGGRFNSTDIDNYLTTYELINNVYEAGLMTGDMLYNAFSYEIVRTYDNKEIQNYLFEIRQEDELFFAGFERLAKSLKISD
jgi:hypothetical protein